MKTPYTITDYLAEPIISVNPLFATLSGGSTFNYSEDCMKNAWIQTSQWLPRFNSRIHCRYRMQLGISNRMTFTYADINILNIFEINLKNNPICQIRISDQRYTPHYSDKIQNMVDEFIKWHSYVHSFGAVRARKYFFKKLIKNPVYIERLICEGVNERSHV